MKYFLLIVLFIATCNNLFSQFGLKSGINSYSKEQYYTCIRKLEPVANNTKTDPIKRSEAAFYVGLSYLKLSRPADAVGYFRLSISSGPGINEAYLFLGESLQMIEQFNEAEKNYQKYISLAPDDTIGRNKYNSLKYCKERMQQRSEYYVQIMPSFNTAEMDYCPFFDAKDYSTVYFTSSRYLESKVPTNKESGESYSNIYRTTQLKDGFWSLAEKIPGDVNTKYDEGTASLNRQSKNLYFTRCLHSTRSDKACRIYVATKSGNYWTKAEQVYIPELPEKVSIGHPCISYDELTLYFTADSLPGSYGGKDIYKVSRAKKSDLFGAPQNLGPAINTRCDESYPYVRSDNIFYFASNGHPGMGGYDIFKAVPLGGVAFEIENMGYPINSPHDDFGIVFMDDEEQGYLSSERIGGMGKSDIYLFYKTEITFDVSGTVWDKQANKPLSNVKISLMNTEYKVLATFETNQVGKYMIKLDKKSDYYLYFYHSDYKTEKIEISTNDLNETKHFTREIFLVK